jgi:hypothetical protein
LSRRLDEKREPKTVPAIEAKGVKGALADLQRALKAAQKDARTYDRALDRAHAEGEVVGLDLAITLLIDHMGMK